MKRAKGILTPEIAALTGRQSYDNVVVGSNLSAVLSVDHFDSRAHQASMALELLVTALLPGHSLLPLSKLTCQSSLEEGQRFKREAKL